MNNRSVRAWGCALMSVIAIACAKRAAAQDPPELPRWHVGPFLDAGINGDIANFQHLPGVPNCCPQFTNGIGLGNAAGLHIDAPIDTGWWFGANLLYTTLDAVLSRTESTPVIVNGVMVDGPFLHEVHASMTVLGIEPHAIFTIGTRWQGMFGVEVAYVRDATYWQQESISQPQGAGTFLDASGNDTHARIRGFSAGAIPGANTTRIAPFIGVRYPLPLNRAETWLLTPQATLAVGVTPVSSDLSWSAHALRIGATLEYAPRAYYEVIRHRDEIDTVLVPGDAIADELRAGMQSERTRRTYEGNSRVTTEITTRTDTLILARPAQHLTATLTTVALDSAGGEIPATRIVMIDERSRLTVPLLPHLFFAENNAEIPARYVALTADQTSGFDERAVNDARKLPTYHHLLNIVGARLRAHPASTITLTGCNQNQRGEAGNMVLSRQRADAVKRYLTDVWHIPAARIVVHARNLPELAASEQSTNADEENRRVDIDADDDAIFDPVITDDTVSVATPSVIQFHTAVHGERAIVSSRLTIDRGGVVVREFAATGELPPSIEWRPAAPGSGARDSSVELRGTYEVRDQGNERAVATSAIPTVRSRIMRRNVEHIAGREVDRFGVLLFDIRSALITPRDARALRCVRDAITPASTITIRGYTDRIGEVEYNRQLAMSRARTAAAAIDAPASAHLEGISMADTYDCTLPEGRMYTRTAEIVVETPAP